MTRDYIAFFVASTLLIFAYFGFSTYFQGDPPITAPAPAVLQQPQETLLAPAAETPLPIVSSPVIAPTEETPGEVFVVETTDTSSLHIQHDLLDIRFVQRGGCLGQVQLKAFHQTIDDPTPSDLFENYPLCKAFRFRVGNSDLQKVSARVERIDAYTIAMTQRVGTLQIRRTFSFTPNSYVGNVRVEVINLVPSAQSTTLAMEIGATSEKDGAGGFFSSHRQIHRNVTYLAADKTERILLPFHSEPEAKILHQAPGIRPTWISSGSMYFLMALLPKNQVPLNLVISAKGTLIQKDMSAPRDQNGYEAWVEQPIQIEAQGRMAFEYGLYLGPTSKSELSKIGGARLDEAIDFGFFAIVAWPLFYLLDFIHSLVGNWGIAIIILTIIVRGLMFPLAKKSYVASKKMMKIQPEMVALREKYKDNKETLNKEMMRLMGEKGANPMSGCLPLLPQMPVFFGLFSVFQQTFELRQASFLYLRDLSVMDPTFVMPILIAVLYYFQQKLMPMSPGMDPAQAKMMQFLPFVFAVMMVTFPSGLALYIITSTVFSIIQQRFMMWKYKEV